MQHDDELYMILGRRSAPPPARAALAERIIHEALASKALRKIPVRFWEEVRMMLALPHPSVALATCVILGIAMGVQAGEGLTIFQQDWSSFLDINEGEWL